MKYLNAVRAIVWKDLLSEKRTIAALGAMIVFALIVILIFVFAFDLAVDLRRSAATGVIWVTLCFAGTLSLDRTLSMERESDGMDGLMMVPVDRTTIYTAKVMVNWFYMLITALIVIGAYALFNNINLFSVGFFAVIVLGTLGYILVGTLIATLTQQLKTRGILLPVLLFPLLVPLVLAAVNASGLVLNGGDPAGLKTWLGVLVTYDLVFLAVGVMIYEKILDE